MTNTENRLGTVESTNTTQTNEINDLKNRLDKLGFRQGSVSLTSGVSATQNVVTRQGNYVIGHLNGISGVTMPNHTSSGSYDYTVHTDSVTVGTLSTNFRPASSTYGGAICRTGLSGGASSPQYTGITSLSIGTDGRIVATKVSIGANGPVQITDIYFGFEANPL